MARRKLQDNIDVDDLMDIATKEDGRSVIHDNCEVLEFIDDLEIVDGDTKVPTYIIYYTYILWKNRSKKRLSKNTFFKEFKKHFVRKKLEDTSAYLLDPDPFDMSVGGFFAARAEVRKEKNAQKRKKKKKQT